jgi:hypothetical protein
MVGAALVAMAKVYVWSLDDLTATLPGRPIDVMKWETRVALPNHFSAFVKRVLHNLPTVVLPSAIPPGAHCGAATYPGARQESAAMTGVLLRDGTSPSGLRAPVISRAPVVEAHAPRQGGVDPDRRVLRISLLDGSG